MKTIVVPILKNKTGDISDLNNCRPIMLATVTAKVLDSVLEKQLRKYAIIYNAQFGFRAGLFTESANVALKYTVRYYTDRQKKIF